MMPGTPVMAAPWHYAREGGGYFGCALQPSLNDMGGIPYAGLSGGRSPYEPAPAVAVDLHGIPGCAKGAASNLYSTPVTVISSYAIVANGPTLYYSPAGITTNVMYVSYNSGLSWETHPFTFNSSGHEKRYWIPNGLGDMIMTSGSSSTGNTTWICNDYGNFSTFVGGASGYWYGHNWIGPDVFVQAGYGSNVCRRTADRGRTWGSTTYAVAINHRNIIGRSDGYGLAIGESSATYNLSFNYGLNWQSATLPATAASSNMLTQAGGVIFYSPNTGSDRRPYFSAPDWGAARVPQWTRFELVDGTSIGSTHTLNDVIYRNNRWYLVAYNSAVPGTEFWVSRDLEHWSKLSYTETGTNGYFGMDWRGRLLLRDIGATPMHWKFLDLDRI